MCQVQVQVFANEVSLANNKRLFERVVVVNDSFTIPFKTIIKAISFLYGLDVIINFKILIK